MAARSLSVATGVAKRSMRKLRKNPVPGLPPIIIPLFMFAAFAGALSGLANTQSFDYYSFTAFQFVFIFYMSSMLAGAFSAFEISGDFEGGMGNRLMLAAPERMAIVGGYLILAVTRFALGAVVVWGIALLAGLPVEGGALDVAGFVGLALLLSLATTLYGAGIALRLQSIAAGTLILIPIFMVLFTSPVFVPRGQLEGWLRTVADINPVTPAIEAGRGFLAGDPVSVALAFGVSGGLVIFFGLFAVRGMVKAEKGPGSGRQRPAKRGGGGGGREETRAGDDGGGGGGRRRGPRGRKVAAR
jgi:ABC-2 type transport system permease protein